LLQNQFFSPQDFLAVREKFLLEVKYFLRQKDVSLLYQEMTSETFL